MEFTLHRIKEIAAEREMSMRKVAKKAGLSGSAITEMIRRNRASIINIQKIAQVLGVPVDDLVKLDQPFDSRENFDLQGIEKSLQAIKEISKNLKETGTTNSAVLKDGYIPLLTFDIMYNKSLSDLLSSDDAGIKDYHIPGIPDADFMLAMPGSAMIPDYLPGDLLILKYEGGEKYPVEYGRAYLVETDGQFYIRRVAPDDNQDKLKFYSPNEAFPPFSINKKLIVSMSKIVAKIRVE